MRGKIVLAWLTAWAVGLVGCAPAVPLIGGGAVVTRSVLQERSTRQALTDTEIEISVQNRLGNHSGELFRDVFVDVTEGAVLLTGSVPKREHTVAAAKAAWAVPGVREVEDEITVAEDSGTTAYLADVRISNQLRYALLTDLDVRSINYTVTTVDRVIHLTGLARSEAELAAVVAHARSIDGVRKVVSHVLTIDDPRRVRRLTETG